MSFTTSAFVKKYTVDNRAKLRAALKKLGSKIEKEREFARLCGMAPWQLAEIREEFSDHYFRYRVPAGYRRAWTGSKKIAAQMRERLNHG